MQTQIQFDEMLEEIDLLKAKRKKWLLGTAYFKNKLDYVELLLRITYELTDKDFEYFVAYLLQHAWFTEIDVQGGREDQGADIIAKKKNQKYLIQCKQWASRYITLKQAGEFYGIIYPLKKQNPDASIAYVTTSYINEEVQDFFHVHGIKGVFSNDDLSNGYLVKVCWELWLFTEEWWSKLIQYIQQQRILKLRKELQKSLPLQSELQKLQTQRVIELRNHLSPSKHKMFINPASIDYASRFFQYWHPV